MARHHNTGKRGENLAAEWLREKGYEILERNWRFSRAEIDLIARFEGILVFLEVKTRSTGQYGHPASFVTHRKMRFLADAAQEYMRQTGYEWEFRFDIIAIVLGDYGALSIEHYPDAFFPGHH